MKALKLLLARILFGFYLMRKFLVFHIKNHIKLFSAVVISILILLILQFTVFPAYNRAEIDHSKRKTVLVPKGATLREIADIMQDNSLLDHKRFFILLGKISGYQNRLQAGLFTVPQDLHPWHLLKYLSQPTLANVKVTIPEGLESSEIAALLKRELEIDSVRFMNHINDSILCRDFGIEAPSLEGYLLPETYFLHYQMNELEIIRILVNSCLKIFEPDSVQLQMAELGMSQLEILTMASIIEGEVVIDSERVIVSSVYHNRLRRGWLLGADPTIQYIIPGPPRRLLITDLEIDSPYNTYIYRGLPPGPINNPGRQSIMAALFPADTKYMYFVASGDGGHRFSRTAAEHARWKENFNRIRREVRRKELYGN